MGIFILSQGSSIIPVLWSAVHLHVCIVDVWNVILLKYDDAFMCVSQPVEAGC